MSSRYAWMLAFATASVLGLSLAAEEEKQITPLPRAHAHNDYEHKRPLLDALEQGFCSVITASGLLLVASSRTT